VTRRPDILFHINPRNLQNWRGKERMAIFTRLAELCEAHGLGYRVVPRPPDEMRRQSRDGDGNLHIVENGRMRGEGWLNTGLAYLVGFWHLDPQGIQAMSSARGSVFDPSEAPPDDAKAFLQGLQRKLVLPRRSRFYQPDEMTTDLPQGAVAVFLQGRAARHAGRCKVPMAELILGICHGSGGRQVIVKPHPQVPEDALDVLARAGRAGAEFHVTGANVHDVLAASAVTVSVNSAVAMEGLMHHRPAILFGNSDFESLAVRIRQPEEFGAALEAALARDWPYAQMLHWYYSRFTVELAAPDFEARAFAAFAKVGFGRERLGVS
jgi:hypothetical protein